MADYGRVAALDIAVISETTARGRVAALDLTLINETTARGRVAALDLAVISETNPRGRVAALGTTLIWSWDTPVALVPNIIGHPFVPATFDATASTGSDGGSAHITARRWSWTSVPGGSALANASLPLPDNGATTWISMANNAVLYHCEGNALDSSGNGNTATLTSITTGAAGKVGSFAWSFNAENARASLTTPVVIGANWTIVFWFFGLDGDGTWREAVQDAGGSVIHISINTGNLLGVYSGGHVSAGFTMNAANYTGWHHMAAVGSGTTTAFYVDGVLVGTAAIKPTANVQYIGTTFNERFAARMDEIAILTRAMSATEIGTLYAMQEGSYAGVGTTFDFTPDVVGTYMVQYSQRDTNTAGTWTDSASAEINPSVAGVWPQGMLREYPFIQGSRLHGRRGQM